MRLLVILMMALMVCGCSSGMWGWHRGAAPLHLGVTDREVILVHIDDSFTKGERSSIEGSLREWNKVFNGQLTLEVGEGFKGLDAGDEVLKDMRKKGEGWIIVRAGSSDEVVSNLSEHALAFAGSGIMVVIWDRIGTRDLKTIVMHEMGHLLGSSHFRSNSLMHPFYGRKQYSCIDKMTVSEVAAAHGLRLETLNYCSTPGFE